jgi:hypothetical protein
MSKSHQSIEPIVPFFRPLWVNDNVLMVDRIVGELCDQGILGWRWILSVPGEVPVSDSCFTFEDARETVETLIMERLCTILNEP